ncbi:conserved hypothetical protein [Ricinus communis]|uniref:Uncharacterized protein n=1 Tax=Ricinus communis TaxID=3988 RepID=B9S489_RICCO|nr:conserved hypothetical protein [Ricinus communis]
MASNSIYSRNLNISVPDRAPCSAGILVDRRRNRGSSTVFDSSIVCHVATLFTGDLHDREAFA